MKDSQIYSKRFAWIAAMLLCVFAVGCKDDVLGIDGAPILRPTVTAVSPADNAIGVPVNNTLITAAFSQPVAPITGDASFRLSCSAPCVNPAGTVSLDPTGKIATFTLNGGASLAPLTLYTATITGVESLANGSTLADPFVWRFTTGVTPDTTRPRVTLTVPATTIPGPTAGVATNTAITALFSEDIAPATISTTSFKVTCLAPCTSPAGTVTYSVGSRTAIFTPAAALAESTTYTATITTAVTDLAGNALAGNLASLPAASNYEWTFTTAAPVIPTDLSVLSTDPAANAVGVCPSASINATFTVPSGLQLNPATINSTTFTVTGPGPAFAPVVAASVVLDIATGRIASFKPLVPLTDGVIYTATIKGGSTGVKDLANPANTLLSDFSWSFTAGPQTGICLPPDTTRPRVTSTIPATTSPGPTSDVPINTLISATFTEAMAPATINATSFTLTCAAPCISPQGNVSYLGASRTAVFTPSSVLDSDTTYTATITTAATDLAGNALAGNQAALPAASNYVWTFATGVAPDTTRPRVTLTVPATTVPGPTLSVPINTAITAVFSENMAPATIGAASFTLTCLAPCTSPAGNVSYVMGSRTAVFTPTAALTPSTTYTATITAAAEDLAGNNLAGNQAPLPAASNYVWLFTTGAAVDSILPAVISTNPANGAAGVCINKTINATFSEPMDPLTITTATFTLTVTAGASVTGVVAYDALTRIASFNPTANLTGTPATSYTATIKGGVSGVKDLAGNALAVDKITTFTTNASTCATAPSLGAAAPFGSFGGNATLTNDGLATVINGDVGVNAASTTITGLRDSGGNVYTVTPNNDGLVNGLVYTLTAPPGSVAGEAVAQARADALLAYNAISPAGLPGGIDVASLAQCPSCGGAGGGADELAGRILPPGVYLSSTGTYDIGGAGRTTDNLTLDAGGDANAVWVFQTAAGTGTLNVGLTGPATPAVPIKVLLINGAQAKNVFWYTPAGATIGTGATVVGTILANASIAISTTGGSPPTAVLTKLDGRAIALTAGVTVTNTVINVPAP